ncbi:MAG: YiiD C-terminal domain-containing protein [Nocardioides sp.]|uniref:YiiD C-terminal domain-containing protein n=1 Tax=Nocardioides sp. TaxID=35761 RepID=UPI003F017AA2
MSDAGADDTARATAMVHSTIPILGHMGIEVLEASAESSAVLLPHAANRNHFGTAYAGSLFSAGEMLGGLVGLALEVEGTVPLVKQMEVEFLRPATSDVVARAGLSPDEVARVRAEASATGRASFTLVATLTDAEGTVVARTTGQYQLRTF